MGNQPAEPGDADKLSQFTDSPHQTTCWFCVSTAQVAKPCFKPNGLQFRKISHLREKWLCQSREATLFQWGANSFYNMLASTVITTPSPARIPQRHRSIPIFHQRESRSFLPQMVPIPSTFLAVGNSGEWPDCPDSEYRTPNYRCPGWILKIGLGISKVSIIDGFH